MITLDGEPIAPQRVFCIGRNYLAHARELGNETPAAPVVFMKPATSLVASAQEIPRPSYGRELHHEAELVILIGRDGRVSDEAQARAAIAGIGLGLDLTLRDVQRDLKARGLPWERAKAFDGSAPLAPMISVDVEQDLSALSFDCVVNGHVRQQGETSRMIFSIPRLLISLSEAWSLREGDLIYTGTPEGVGPLEGGDVVELRSPDMPGGRWEVG